MSEIDRKELPVGPPLAVRMRPTHLTEVVGQRHILQKGSVLQKLAQPGEDKQGISVILWGPPGTGKTTLAQIIARSSGMKFVELSAVTAGVKDVRKVMEDALNQRDLYGTRTVLFLDEIHRFTKSQQDALLPGVENGWVILIAATTENPSFSVVAPLLSRSLLLTLQLLSEEDLEILLQRALTAEHGLANAVELSDGAHKALIQLAQGDARRLLTMLEASAQAAFAALSEDDPGQPVISEEIIEQTVDRALLRYDRQGDEHYDVISAFIKSIRGSNPDAAIHYLARMIEAGEDPRFIARRLIISAAEDVGLADPQALNIAVSCAEAIQLIGMPEGRIPLAEATIYLATAPKSNRAYEAINAATEDIRQGRFSPVPAHLRDAHYAGAKRLGAGKGYQYPHDDPLGVSQQQYLPDALVGKQYYVPKNFGVESAIAERLEKLRKITDK